MHYLHRALFCLQTPKLSGNAHYCAVAKSNHFLCRISYEDNYKSANGEETSDPFGDEDSKRLQENTSSKTLGLGSSKGNQSQLPLFCGPMSTAWSSFVSPPKQDLPLIATYVPFCTTHLRCGWLYILVVGSVALLTSCLLAVCFVHCCCR